MKTIHRGINVSGFGDWSEENPLFKEEYFEKIKKAGFDHVRLPVYFGAGTGVNLSEEYFDIVRRLIGFVRNNDMVAIVDMHGFLNMDQEPLRYRDSFIETWGTVAAKLSDLDEDVWFEIINEPHDNFNAVLLNDFQNNAIKAIRRTNPGRMLVAACAHFNTVENLETLVLPEDDENIIVTIHNYVPMSVTHQGAEWCHGKYPSGVKWLGTPDEIKCLVEIFDTAYNWSQKTGRKLWLSEFGVYYKGEIESRIRWTECVVRLCEERGILWAYWEFGCGFSVYDMKNDCWREDLMSALMPEFKS